MRSFLKSSAFCIVKTPFLISLEMSVYVSAAIAVIALVTVDTILDTTPEMSASGILVTSNTAAVTKEITFLRYLL